ncbi:ATP-binding cassette domain-containing protein [Erythrobacter sp. JK5]|uniref:ATP-binding cassette domain-containing protein n=1 Tax=Erythrobacter sp. JK5 TaxID=2829500 RepID=UPI001BA8572D|nr:ATP-binding cassette domain-containing protein [Erythrobacter sp. JK5]QUL37992.1 ATP-binding cassette domain-containing protein [Erythrobacter sp. JK5]
MSRLDERLEGIEIDSLSRCVAEIAARYATVVAPSAFAQLPRNADGRLPWHQAESALELAGVNFDAVTRSRLPTGTGVYPALVELLDGRFVLAIEARDGDLLVWKPDIEGEVWVPRAEIADQFAGRLYSVFANPDIQREGEAPWHAKARGHWFWGELRKERRSFWPVILASLLINVLAVALPLFTMNVYDRVIPNRATETLWVLGAGVALVFALEFALRRGRTAVLDQITKRLDLKLSQKIFGRLLATPLQERQGHTGSLAARVSEYAIVRDFFASTTVVLMIDVLFLFVFVGVIAIIGGWLALIPLTIITAMLIAGYILQRKVTAAAQDAQADYGLQQTLLVESLAGMETLKSMGGEGGALGRWYRLAEAGAHSQERLRNINSVAVGLAQTFQQVSTVSLIIGGYFLFAAGQISMGAIIAIVMLASRSLAPAGQIAYVLTRGRQANEMLASIERLFEASDERQRGGSLAPATVSRPLITLKDVRFSYPESGQPALDGLNFEFKPGERVAIVGRVASGKSTLGRILCGLYQPSEGTMLVNGLDAGQYRPEQLRDALRFVGQDADLFSGSIRDNLSLGRRDATDERMLAALRQTGADQFLARDNGGFERPVGEGGRRLSGGQRSFLALTRALVTPCELLYLDEPTGAMDSQTEKLFADRLAGALSEHQTLVIATHRPALFALCERLIVLSNGKVAADGPIKQVLESAGAQFEGLAR